MGTFIDTPQRGGGWSEEQGGAHQHPRQAALIAPPKPKLGHVTHAIFNDEKPQNIIVLPYRLVCLV